MRGGRVNRESRKQVMLAAVAGFQRRQGYGPSVQSIGGMIGAGMTATVHHGLV